MICISKEPFWHHYIKESKIVGGKIVAVRIKRIMKTKILFVLTEFTDSWFRS